MPKGIKPPGRARRHNHRVHKCPLPMSITFKARRRNHPGRALFISFKAQRHNPHAQRHHHRAHSQLLLFIPFKAQRHNHRAQKHHHCAQSQLLMFIPFKARRHNHCARQPNHRVLKAPYLYYFKARRQTHRVQRHQRPNHRVLKAPYLYYFKARGRQTPIVSKGITSSGLSPYHTTWCGCLPRAFLFHCTLPFHEIHNNFA